MVAPDRFVYPQGHRHHQRQHRRRSRQRHGTGHVLLQQRGNGLILLVGETKVAVQHLDHPGDVLDGERLEQAVLAVEGEDLRLGGSRTDHGARGPTREEVEKNEDEQ